MAVALGVAGPIKGKPLDIIDLDKAKTPAEAIYEWHDKVRKELNKHILLRGENELLEIMEWYLEQLKFQGKYLQDPETLQNVIIKHIKVIELSFKRLKARKSDSHYLDLMEEIMTRFCDVVVENASQKKKVVPKREMKKIMALSCRRIKCLLYHCLLASQQRIQHVLIKMQIDPGSQPCRDIINYVYAHFLTRIKQEQTDEAFCRGYIIFQKWKMVRKPEEADTVDRCLYSLYGHLPKNVATHEIFRSVVKLVSTSIAGMTRDYFAYIRARERDLEKREMALDTVFDDVADLDIAKNFGWERPRGSDSDFSSAYKRWDAEIHAFSVGNTDGDDVVLLSDDETVGDDADDVVPASDDETVEVSYDTTKKATAKSQRATVESSEPSTMTEERLLANPDLTRDGDASRSLSACSFLDDAASMTSAKSSATCECDKCRDFETPPPPPPHIIKTDTPLYEQPDVAVANETKEAQVDDGVANQSTTTYVIMKLIAAEEAGLKSRTATSPIAKCTTRTRSLTEASVEQTPVTPSSMFLHLMTSPSEEQAMGGHTSRMDNCAAVKERTYQSNGEEDYKNASHYYSSFSPMINARHWSDDNRSEPVIQLNKLLFEGPNVANPSIRRALNDDDDGPKIDTKLPLKKRKMMAAPPKTDFDQMLMNYTDWLLENPEISYPATPMLSIAEVQEHEKMGKRMAVEAENGTMHETLHYRGPDYHSGKKNFPADPELSGTTGKLPGRGSSLGIPRTPSNRPPLCPLHSRQISARLFDDGPLPSERY
ncbi:uncharacterized protein LOC132707117 isoform X2 [Cylas formicarius]|uniref:uncharacterized protein LOC132707117 isoform X2 n=1 Tax=Cylas formicarius TaxID=197179 RepID=UPI0029583711|nr:uncharacterized protein LOC132707117 isoform X2 [Cylas formicarius]